MKFDKAEEEFLSILQSIKPYVPILVGLQMLSSASTDFGILSSNKIFSFLLQKKFSLVSVVVITALFLYWARKSTVDDLKKEASRFNITDKTRSEDDPLMIETINNTSIQFVNVDEMAQFVGNLYVSKNCDIATKSFTAARRTVVLGWIDPYALRTAEFLAVRSLEQLLHERYPDGKFIKQNKITAINKSKESLFKDKPVINFLCVKFGSKFNIENTINELIEIRDCFAHRDDPSFEESTLRFKPFELVSALLQYRDSIT
ncbi:hypothetical protein [Acidithiobacillus sp.]|uniref:hypothetical protein n=1 Tax=Acidithiobacillus sp. TaxID=1872118 RepID=UPI00263995C6|nr:hypothetical protein [Acidithiobacillus sp.]MDD5279042.1 hypothetical protein [Acidithiobacillus sp.]